jgi:hypothetical protein
MSWPDHYPDDCPFKDAYEPNEMTVYYFVPLEFSLSGFRTHYDKYLKKNYKYSSDIKKCEACGLSVFTNKDDMEHLKQLPYFRDKCKIASGKLTRDSGLIKNTPSKQAPSHHTWWVLPNYDPSQPFKNSLS